MMFKAYKRALDGLFIDEIIHIHSFGLCSKGKRDLGLSESRDGHSMASQKGWAIIAV